MRGQGHELERIEQREELDFDDPAVLAAAVAQAFTEFPADRHGLVLWDHGGAWSVGFGGDSQDGTRRQAPGLPTEEVAAAVQAGLRRAGLTGTRPLDFFSFDACLMGGAESITAFRTWPRSILADAELDYGDGWDYTATLDWLSENLAASARELAAFEVQAWDAHHRTASLNDAVAPLARRHRQRGAGRASSPPPAPWWGPPAARWRPRRWPSALQRSLPAYRSQVSSPRGIAAARPRRPASTAWPPPATATWPPPPRRAASAGRAARIAVSGGSLREGQLGVHVFAGPPLALPAADVERYPRLARPWSAGSGWGDLLQQLRALADGRGARHRGDPRIRHRDLRFDLGATSPASRWSCCERNPVRRCGRHRAGHAGQRLRPGGSLRLLLGRAGLAARQRHGDRRCHPGALDLAGPGRPARGAHPGQPGDRAHLLGRGARQRPARRRRDARGLRLPGGQPGQPR